MKRIYLSRKLLLIIVLFVTLVSTGKANRPDSVAEPVHEITIYTMPSLMPLNWESPSALYKSLKKCYLKTLLERDNYLIGHIAVGLKSPLLDHSPLYIAMTSANKQQRTNLVLKEKIGLGIMGASLDGRIEKEEEIKHNITTYTQRKKIAFITYRINERAFRRILEFLDGFRAKQVDGHAACDFYGGAFWPRYKNEGSGCSAFAMTMLDINHLLDEDSQHWYQLVNIPMKIVGGEYNNATKVKNHSITKTKQWHKGDGASNTDFIVHKIYEPSDLFTWIQKERNHPGGKYLLVEENGAPGLYIDSRNVIVPADEPVFFDRVAPDLFIQHYQQKRKLNH